MKKCLLIILLGIVLIGSGAKSKFDAQFPYQLDIENADHSDSSMSDRFEAMKQFRFTQLGNRTLEQAASEINSPVTWDASETKTGSLLISATGIAEYNDLAEHTPFELIFRVLKDGRMKMEDDATLNEQPTDPEKILTKIRESAGIPDTDSDQRDTPLKLATREG